jgi:hypothetical protein
MLKIIQRFGKHCSCHLQPALFKASKTPNHYIFTLKIATACKKTGNLILEEGIVIKQVDYAKYLGTIINKTEGIGKEEIRNRIDQSKIYIYHA